MSQQTDTYLKTFTATEALAVNRRVKLTTSSGNDVEYADQTDSSSYIGVTTAAAALGDPVVVALTSKPGTFTCVAADTFAEGATIYAADDGKVSDTSSGNIIGTALEACTTAGDEVECILRNTVSTSTVPRTSLVEDALQVYALPLRGAYIAAETAILGASAGTPSGACGFTPGTVGSATEIIVGEAASGNSKSDTFRYKFTLPPEYVSAGDCKIRVRGKRTGTLQVGGTVDVSVYESDGDGGVSADLVTTAAQTVTASAANYDFVVTATTLAAGDTLDILVTLAADDTGGTNNKLVQCSGFAVLLDIKG